MRELVYYVAVSLDGYIADPGGGYDAFTTEGDHMSAITGEYADALPTHALTALGLEPPRTLFDTVIQGRATYNIAHALGINRPYAHLREYVATRSEATAPTGVRFTSDALATAQQLKQEPGLSIYLCGGGNLAGALLPEIDRLILKRNPIVLGAGIPLFGNTASPATAFTLTACRAFTSGVIIEEYEKTQPTN